MNCRGNRDVVLARRHAAGARTTCVDDARHRGQIAVLASSEELRRNALAGDALYSVNRTAVTDKPLWHEDACMHFLIDEDGFDARAGADPVEQLNAAFDVWSESCRWLWRARNYTRALASRDGLRIADARGCAGQVAVGWANGLRFCAAAAPRPTLQRRAKVLPVVGNPVREEGADKTLLHGPPEIVSLVARLTFSFIEGWQIDSRTDGQKERWSEHRNGQKRCPH